ncbi:hypothetical protein [Chondromyces crocatus]|uniref:Yip1 domain-containing protein n=1 Tax=Chondromyces crocatus TaxID=52 RepID=A0A0K1ELT2_CHOCO|nr:hypothetical protein [Chondromyces crocatus]AKT41558.1 uncharacterized protein CMC5_057650 [Chondromyces crocatus]
MNILTPTTAAPSLAILSRLLRDPTGVAQSCRSDRDLGPLATTSLLAITLGAMAFGGVIGSFRGGIQIGYAALKIPLTLLVSLALCAPGFHALAAVMGRTFPMRAVISLSLAAAARAALVLLACAPVLWLLFDLGLHYHDAAMASAMAYGLAGLASLGVLLRGLGKERGRALTAFAFIALFFAVSGQTSWILRPYLVRPRTETPPFLRAREGSFGDALWTSSRSARGIYQRQPSDRRWQDDTDTRRIAPEVPRSSTTSHADEEEP